MVISIEHTASSTETLVIRTSAKNRTTTLFEEYLDAIIE